jgi:TRAP-type transport system small permease protein
MTKSGGENFLFYKYLMVFLKYLLVVLSVFLVIIVFGNVVGRYAFNFSLAWSEEASRFLFIWVILIGSILTNEKYEHMNLDILVQWLPGRGGRIVQIIAQLVILTVLAIIFRGGSIVTVEDLSWKSPALEVSYGLIYGIVPFSCAVMFYQTLVRLAGIVKALRTEKQ